MGILNWLTGKKEKNVKGFKVNLPKGKIKQAKYHPSGGALTGEKLENATKKFIDMMEEENDPYVQALREINRKNADKWNKKELMALYFYLTTMGYMDGDLVQDEKDVILALISSKGDDKHTADVQTWSSFIDTANQVTPEDHLQILKLMSEEKKLQAMDCLNTVAYSDGILDEKEKKLYRYMKGALE